MPNIDPKVALWLGLILCVTQVIDSAGPSLLQGAIPAQEIGFIVAWCGIVTKIGIPAMTYISGVNMTNAGRLANIKPVPLLEKMDSFADNNKEVKNIITTQAIADATNSDKIVGPPKAEGVK